MEISNELVSLDNAEWQRRGNGFFPGNKDKYLRNFQLAAAEFNISCESVCKRVLNFFDVFCFALFWFFYFLF
ncbi:hypothetical protein V4890_19910 [Ralstonia solanacearum species complex bacterium KE056]|uniref:hypothetical protein n=1 Tax=Ralstonia solanacearum species complex bacterium KE056 TaxID=3119585 RepID=UPI002FC310FE